MPKLSATSGMDPEAITRVDITPAMIKEMSDAEIEDLLRKMRGNREVAQAKSAGPRQPRSPKTPKANDSDEDVFI